MPTRNTLSTFSSSATMRRQSASSAGLASLLPATSTGLTSEACGSRISASRRRVSSPSGASVSPASAMRSDAMVACPPPSDTTATRLPCACCSRARPSATGRISSESSTTLTPAWRSRSTVIA
ncbi:hypothetical protein [Thauera sp. SDU_THAU2]|uniref:hypothetical protein n=1 Tax=Thauera sp. SDU_THAU2 TaxID=3136633 RepID=UPI00311DE8FD